MTELLVAFVVVVLLCVVVYRRTPYLSTPWRIVVRPIERDSYHDVGGVTIYFVQRFLWDGKKFAHVKYGEDFDKRMSEAMVEARNHQRAIVTTKRVAHRLDRHV